MKDFEIMEEIDELRAELEKLRGLIIFEINGFCVKNWFSREHSYNYKNQCKFCGTRR